jgi:hypothetical protein
LPTLLARNAGDCCIPSHGKTLLAILLAVANATWPIRTSARHENACTFAAEGAAHGTFLAAQVLAVAQLQT